ncbi:hypothetical protein M569_16546, partial [Genlisea aurea]
MSSSVCLVGTNLVLSPFLGRTRTGTSFFQGTTHFSPFNLQKSFSGGVARFGLGQVPFPDPESSEMAIRDLFGRVEGLLYTIADASVESSSDGAVTAAKQNSDWLSGITNTMEVVLKVR